LSRVTLVYNGDQQRVEKDTASQVRKYVLDGQNILLETDGANASQEVFTLEPLDFGKLLSQRQLVAGLWVPIHYSFDGLGSADSLTDSNQVITDTYTYYAFGLIKASSGTTSNEFTWAGELGYIRDAETGEYGLAIRQYLPDRGRFKSEDPLGLDPDPNPYSYVGNKAPNLVDPSGNAPNMPVDMMDVGPRGGVAGTVGQVPVSPRLRIPVAPGSSPMSQQPPLVTPPGALEIPPGLKEPLGIAGDIFRAIFLQRWMGQALLEESLQPIVDYANSLIAIQARLLDYLTNMGLVNEAVELVARRMLELERMGVIYLAALIPPDIITRVLDLAELAANLLGMTEIPVVAQIGDALALALSLLRRDWVGVGLGALAFVPFVGILFGLGKIGRLGARLRRFRRLRPLLDKVDELLKLMRKKLDELTEALTWGMNWVADAVRNLYDRMKKSVEELAERVRRWFAPSTTLDWNAVVPKKGPYKGQPRDIHVRLHNVDNLAKPQHGVFTGDGVNLTNEAWARAQSLGLKPDAGGNLTVPMGKTVGHMGGQEGVAARASGQPTDLTSITIAVRPGTTEVITAFPSR
jgi:RHS repeat-associated protein